VQKIIIIGPAHPLRGGLASFNERMALEFYKGKNQVQLFSFSLQYPSVLFPGKTQFSSEPPPENVEIHSMINSINPLNWIRIGNRIRAICPDIVIFRYWIPFMSPCFGTIARIIRKNNFTKILCIADNILPHEKRLADKLLTNYFIKPIDGFITMSDKVTNDLLQFHSDKPIKHAIHPLYDNFGSLISKEVAREKLNLDKSENHLLLIAGEFYQDKQPYLDLIKSLQLEGSIKIVDDFIPDSMVRYYCCAADVIVQPYKNATQSGVTPLAYHFEKPMIVTNVGGLPSMVVDGETGLVCEPNPESIADQIVNYFQKGEEFFIPSLIKEKTKFSWYNFTKNIQSLANDIQK
jgi:glycosyltransferase involved in cell wall biosynthesis